MAALFPTLYNLNLQMLRSSTANGWHLPGTMNRNHLTFYKNNQSHSGACIIYLRGLCPASVLPTSQRPANRMHRFFRRKKYKIDLLK